MKELAFSNEKYVEMQSAKIRERISNFDGKLYLEFGGKLFDDNHASRVLPGFEPDSKLKMLLSMKDVAEVVIVISAIDIESNKIRSDLGITYDFEVLRLIDSFRSVGLFVGSVCITQFGNQPSVDAFKTQLENLGIKVYLHYPIAGYPGNIPLIVSEQGYGKNDYIETTRPLVVITAPGPGSGKMAACLSQLYHEHLRGVQAGYAKFETFPIWNLPLKHPVNLAYEAATANLNDVNMIDPFHLEAYGETTVNYNRDVEIFPVLNAIFEKIMGTSPYKSPTDMGVNMAGNCIINNDSAIKASNDEIIRRYYTALMDVEKGRGNQDTVDKIKMIMSQAKITVEDRPCVKPAVALSEETKQPACAIELEDGTIIKGKTTSLLGCSSAALVNSLKHLAGIPDEVYLISPSVIEPIQKLKVGTFGSNNPRLHTDEVLLALSICACTDENAAKALEQLPKLKNCEAHCSVIISEVDQKIFRKLHINLTCEPKYQTQKLFRNS